MKPLATGILVLVYAISFVPVDYARQYREAVNAPPSSRFPLGTDDLGRDRLARLLEGSRISLILAPLAAAASLIIAALVGVTAGLAGGWWDRIAMRATDLLLALPWLFLFLTARSLLPLNAAPAVSIVITFALMSLIGWGPPARVIRAAARNIRQADFILQARACGCRESRIWMAHLAPHMQSLLLAQFWIAVPVFILAEAGLGLLGLGVAEPLPSWGNLLRELETAPGFTRYWLFAPIGLLVLVMTCFQLLVPSREVPS